MRTCRTVAELRRALVPTRHMGGRIGLVPTMGAFHPGHLGLMREARTECDTVVVSLFVNPVQFNERADLDAYPRDERRDADLAATVGVDLLFAPSAEEVYPAGFSTTVHVGGVSEPLEGAHRGTAHFDGVATVVTKLLGMVGPDVAYFGQKDAQQVLVIRRLVRDLNLAVEVRACPTVREADGLAMSSRNARLSPAERSRATALSRALEIAAGSRAGGETQTAALLAPARRLLRDAGVETEYLEVVDADTLQPLEEIDGRAALAVVAARIGATRLIDNRPLDGGPPPTKNQNTET